MLPVDYGAEESFRMISFVCTVQGAITRANSVQLDFMSGSDSHFSLLHEELSLACRCEPVDSENWNSYYASRECPWTCSGHKWPQTRDYRVINHTDGVHSSSHTSCTGGEFGPKDSLPLPVNSMSKSELIIIHDSFTLMEIPQPCFVASAT